MLFLFTATFCIIVAYIFFQFNLYRQSYNIPGYHFQSLWYLLQRKSIKSLFEELFQKYDEICKCWIGPVLFIFVSKPEYIRKISYEYICKNNSLMKFVSGDGLISVDSASDWKRHRKMINPIFKLTKLNQHYKVINAWSKQLTLDLQQNNQNIYYLIFRNKLCLSNQCFFNCNPLSTKTIDNYINLILEINYQWSFGLFSFKPIWKLTKIGKKFLKNCKNLQKWAAEIVKKACNDKENHLVMPEFMNSLLDNKKLSYEEIIGNVLGILNASVTTTASTEVFLFILLAMHDKIQNNLFEEIDSLWNKQSDSLQLESVKDANLLDRVIKETLRLFPSVPAVVRKADKTIRLDESYTIAKGAYIIAHIFNVQRNTRIWNDPLKFDPDRFLPERFTDIQQGSYVPFWLFSRNCIRQYFSMLSLKLSVAHVVKLFKITRCCYKDVLDIKLRSSTFVEPQDCYLEFKLR